MISHGLLVTRGFGIPSDTDAAAHQVQHQIYLRLGGSERIAIAFRLSDSVRRLAIAGIRQRHPDYSDAQVQQAFARLRLGDAVLRAMWPDRALVDP
jgi:hypothetical protein